MSMKRQRGFTVSSTSANEKENAHLLIRILIFSVRFYYDTLW